MSESCHFCDESFESWHELALHISASRKGHQEGKKWAAKFLAGKPNRPDIKHIAENPDYKETEFGKENRANAVKVLSGDTEYANTHCPNCNHGSRQLLPVEYVQSNRAWRNTIGTLMVNCQNCRKE